MMKEGILDGDYIVVESRSHADNGDTVVALVQGDATVKPVLSREGGDGPAAAGERPDGPDHRPRRRRRDPRIVVAVMRKYLPARKRPAA